MEPNLIALPDNVLLYTFQYPCSELCIRGATPDLQWLNLEHGWVPVGDSEWLKLASEDSIHAIRLKLPDQARWSTLSVTLRSEGKEKIMTLFPSGGTRLAGVFDGKDQLLAFGEEQVFYVAPEPPLELPPNQGQSLSVWTRVSGVALPPRQAKAAKRVVTIDLDGRTFESKMPEPTGKV